MILVNFKIYKETFGNGAVKLAEICKKVMEKTKVKIIPVVSALDVYRIKKEVGIEVMVQAVNEYDDGAKTGYISPIQAQICGASGSLINHSEHQLKPGTIKKMLKKWPDGFNSVVCLKSLGQTESWAKNLKADFIAYEPSELIGSKDKSVATEKPEIIKKIVEKYPKISVIIGAGIKNREDIEVSLKLGAKGVLISSAIAKSNDPEAELLKLASAFSV